MYFQHNKVWLNFALAEFVIPLNLMSTTFSLMIFAKKLIKPFLRDSLSTAMTAERNGSNVSAEAVAEPGPDLRASWGQTFGSHLSHGFKKQLFS